MFKTYEYILGNEKDKASGEHYFIKQALGNSMQVLENNNKLSDQAIKNLMNYYSDYYRNQNTSFLLTKDKEIIFSNLQYTVNNLEEKLFNLNKGQNLTMVEENKNKYILISGVMDNSIGKYHLVYCYKLERIMGLWNKLKSIFIYLSLIISLILAILLALLINGRSKPLKQLLVHVNEIKDGNYHSKVKIGGKDEFAMLGDNFNEMSEKIRITVQQLNNDMEMKQKFIDNLSHELRTPLTSIYGYAEYIQKAVISEEDKYEATKYIMEESQRLQYMANRLLDITIRRQNKLIKNHINVDELFDKVLRTISPLANEKSITIKVNNELTNIIGEVQLIESLLVNLLDNSLKASKNNGFIQIKGFALKQEAIIEIIDKGKGISQKHIAHITEPFYRADKARSKAEGGAGLGLTLCKQIMDMHEGKLLITSEVNKGTTVSLIFTTS
jgi:signal transduction histidine kinase